MSDEESFVILGSSPMSSLEIDGLEDKNALLRSSLQSDTPGSRFTSLKDSQQIDLKNAQEMGTQTPEPNQIQPELAKTIAKKIPQGEEVSIVQTTDLAAGETAVRSQMTDSQLIKLVKGPASWDELHDLRLQSQTVEPVNNQSKSWIKPKDIALWSRASQEQVEESIKHSLCNIEPEMTETMKNIQFETQGFSLKKSELLNIESKTDDSIGKRSNETSIKELRLEENMMALSLEDCALKSPLNGQSQQKAYEKVEQMSTSVNQKDSENSSESSGNSTTMESSLAASFIMGEVNADVLKTSVYSQFPSISMEACAEDVVKLQNMVTEYTLLKSTIKKANNTMKLFYTNSLQWKCKMKTMEENYKAQLEKCQEEFRVLRKQNEEMKNNFELQIEALEIARKKDREETIQELSEKNALLENFRAQIIKLEQQQLASFEIVMENQGEQQFVQFNKVYVTRREHESKIKDLQRQLSELLASNLDFKDVEKQYVDELNCLKVNLTASEELIKKNHAEISELIGQNKQRQQQIERLNESMDELRQENEEQKERILLLEHQNEVHRRDFEMEQESRQTAVKDKQQILQDLRTLQKRNQELIEEHQKIADGFKKRLSAGATNDLQITAASAAAQTYFNNPQRPIRVSDALPSPSLSSSTATQSIALHPCPLCNKCFKSLAVLQSHVNDCLDTN